MITIKRVAAGKNSTLSHLYLDDIFHCYLLEDSIRENKIKGITCIPIGEYTLELNTSAGMNRHYHRRFPAMHQGMIEICGIPDYNLVFLHLGNYHSDTSGCPLTGRYWKLQNEEYQVMESAHAYQQVYPRLLRCINSGSNVIRVMNRLQEQ